MNPVALVRRFASHATGMNVGAKFPTHCILHEGNPGGVVNTAELLAGKKVVVVGVPGAFTPTCGKQLPAYVADAEKFKAKGVDAILFVSVNDAFVMNEWGVANNATGKVRMIADTHGELSRALGVEAYLRGLGGIRSKRWSALVEDGVFKIVNREPETAPTDMTCSASDYILKQL